MGYYISNNELYHFGIKGQKWGIRRYQNPDGTLTEAGKRRKAKEESLSDDEKRFRELKKKKFSEMSNDEVNEYNNRANLYQNYKRLTPSKIAKGMAIIASVTGTMMAVNKLVSTSKQFNKNIKEIVVDPVIDKLGNIVVSDMNKRLKAPLTHNDIRYGSKIVKKGIGGIGGMANFSMERFDSNIERKGFADKRGNISKDELAKKMAEMNKYFAKNSSSARWFEEQRKKK